MSPALTAAALWVLAAAVTAMLPMRRQYPPGITLLILAPVLLIWIGWTHGPIWTLIGTAGFVSMFRNPLIYLARRSLGLPTFLPEERRPGRGRGAGSGEAEDKRP